MRTRLLDRTNAKRIFVLAPAGSGKSTLLRHIVDHAPGPAELIDLGREHADPRVLERALDTMLASGTTTIAMDNAERVAGGAAGRLLERYVTSNVTACLVVASRRPLGFVLARAELADAEVIDGRDLAFRLDEITTFLRLHGMRPSLAVASAVLVQTGGWPIALRMLASFTRDGRGITGADSVLTALSGERWFAVPGLDATLSSPRGRPAATTIDAAAVSALWPQVTRDRLASAGASGTAETVLRLFRERVLDVATVEDSGLVLPPVVRRELARRLDPHARAAVARRVAAALEREGAFASAAAVLADSAEWGRLSQLVARRPFLLLNAGSCPWALTLPDAQTSDPWLRLAAVRALVDDRALVATTLLDEHPLDGPALDDPAHARAAAALRSHIRAGMPPPNGGKADPPLDREAVPGVMITMHALDVPAALLRHGDILGALRILQRAATSRRRDDEIGVLARFILVIAGGAITTLDDTSAQLFELERDAVGAGLSGLARLVRGAIAAASTAPDARRQLTWALDSLEDRGDQQGAATVEAIRFLFVLRNGRASAGGALELAERFASLGDIVVAAWLESAAALLAANAAEPRAGDLIRRAHEGAVRLGIPGIGAVIDAASASLGPADSIRLAERSRATARASGMPHLPTAVQPRTAYRTDVRVEFRAPEVSVTCFGGFSLRLDGREFDLGGVRPQAKTLLRLLALNAGAPVHRELIAEVLWGDLPLTSAVHALHVSVSTLRRALSTDATTRDCRVIERRDDAYALRLDARRDCDLSDFDYSLTAASDARSRGRVEAMAGHLRHAVGLYAGEVLPEDGPAEWVLGARDRYRARASEAAASLARLELRIGRPAAAVEAAERAVEIDPWTDAAWRALVSVHRETGDRISSARAEQAYRRMLASLGIG